MVVAAGGIRLTKKDGTTFDMDVTGVFVTKAGADYWTYQGQDWGGVNIVPTKESAEAWQAAKEAKKAPKAKASKVAEAPAQDLDAIIADAVAKAVAQALAAQAAASAPVEQVAPVAPVASKAKPKPLDKNNAIVRAAAKQRGIDLDSVGDLLSLPVVANK